MDFLLCLLLLLCMAAFLPAATSLNYSIFPKPYSQIHRREAGKGLYEVMGGGRILVQRRHSESERVVDEGELMDVHEKRDLDALLSFKNAITYSQDDLLSNWTTENSENICSWYGIRCRPYSRRVVAIHLSGQKTWRISARRRVVAIHLSNEKTYSDDGRVSSSFGMFLMGTLPPSLGNLLLLHTLNLSCNILMGRIPPEFGQLEALRLLDLSYNYMNGSIPVQLGLLQKLKYLVLDGYGHEFSGKIPFQLDNLTQLTQLAISSNSGFIPLKYSDFPFRLPLSYLSLHVTLNRIPNSIANLRELAYLDLSNNVLTGIPESIATLTKLTYLDLAFNNISNIPEQIASLNFIRIDFFISFSKQPHQHSRRYC